MNIAFWSNVRHQSGVTACVAAMGILWAEVYAEEVVLTANHVCNKSLMERLHGGSEWEERKQKKGYCYSIGEPEYFRLLYSAGRERKVWLNNNLCYIPMEGEEIELFCGGSIREFERQLGESKCLMIDTACGCGSSSRRVLDEAELTVVLLPSEKETVDAFFQSGTPLQENSFFILGNYRASSPCCPSYIARKYKIPKERIGIILHSEEFEQAMLDGSTIAFLSANMKCSRKSKSYRFIQHALKTSKNLREYAMKRREEVCVECEGA